MERKTIQQLEAERLEWSLKNFPEATQFSSLEKLKCEIYEVEQKLENALHGMFDGLSEEYADCLMCLFDSAGRVGIKPDEIFKAFALKLEINKKRKWKKNGNNTYSHVK